MTITDDRWRRALLPVDATLAQTIQNLNEVSVKLALCVDGDGKLLGSVSDGDIRRGLLRGLLSCLLCLLFSFECMLFSFEIHMFSLENGILME